MKQKMETRPVCNHCGDLIIQASVVRGRGYASDVARRATGLEIARRVGKRMRPGGRLFAMVAVKRGIGLMMVQKIGK